MPNFKLFPLLPPELRNRVWYFFLRSPRVVKIIHIRSTSQTREISRTLRSLTPPASSLQACQESRKEALKFYEVFTPERSNGGMPGMPYNHVGFRIPINLTFDTVYFASAAGKPCYLIDFIECLEDDDLQRIQHLAVDGALLGGKVPDPLWIFQFCKL